MRMSARSVRCSAAPTTTGSRSSRTWPPYHAVGDGVVYAGAGNGIVALTGDE
jgi:hypothetical protein